MLGNLAINQGYDAQYVGCGRTAVEGGCLEGGGACLYESNLFMGLLFEMMHGRAASVVFLLRDGHLLISRVLGEIYGQYFCAILIYVLSDVFITWGLNEYFVNLCDQTRKMSNRTSLQVKLLRRYKCLVLE